MPRFIGVGTEYRVNRTRELPGRSQSPRCSSSGGDCSEGGDEHPYSRATLLLFRRPTDTAPLPTSKLRSEPRSWRRRRTAVGGHEEEHRLLLTLGGSNGSLRSGLHLDNTLKTDHDVAIQQETERMRTFGCRVPQCCLEVVSRLKDMGGGKVGQLYRKYKRTRRWRDSISRL